MNSGELDSRFFRVVVYDWTNEVGEVDAVKARCCDGHVSIYLNKGMSIRSLKKLSQADGNAPPKVEDVEEWLEEGGLIEDRLARSSDGDGSAACPNVERVDQKCRDRID